MSRLESTESPEFGRAAGRELLATALVAAPLAVLLYVLAWNETVLELPFTLFLLSMNYPWDANNPIHPVRIWLASLWMVWPWAWVSTRGLQRVAARVSSGKDGQVPVWTWPWRLQLPLGGSLGLALAVWLALFLLNLLLPWEF